MRGLSLIVALLLCALSASAQEVLVPFDSLGKVERIDRDLENKLGLFPEYSGFREAQLYQLSDTSFSVEITHEDSGKVIRTRIVLTVSEMNDLRKKVMNAIYEEAPQTMLDHSGRKKLIAGTLTMSVFYHGWALPAAAEADGASAGGMYLILAAGGYFVPLMLTAHSPVTSGMATLAIYGGSRGIGHGIMLDLILEGEDVTTAVLAAGSFFSIAEEASFVAWARKTEMTDGDAMAIGVMGDFGAAIGVGLAHMTTEFEKESNSAIAVWILTGSAAGIATGAILADKITYTRGDALILRNVGVLGALWPVTILDFASPKEDKAYSTVAVIGAICGLGAGHALIGGRNFTTDEGALVTLGELAGGLFGLGVVTLAEPEGDKSAAYWAGASLGATGGFLLTYSMFQKGAQVKLPHHARLDFGIQSQPRVPLDLQNRITPPEIPMASLNIRF